MSITVDTAQLPMLLGTLRLPTIARLWPDFCSRADKEGWPASRLLAALAELELAEREQRRIQRHLTEARLPPGKTLDAFDFSEPDQKVGVEGVRRSLDPVKSEVNAFLLADSDHLCVKFL